MLGCIFWGRFYRPLPAGPRGEIAHDKVQPDRDLLQARAWRRERRGSVIPPGRGPAVGREARAARGGPSAAGAAAVIRRVASGRAAACLAAAGLRGSGVELAAAGYARAGARRAGRGEGGAHEAESTGTERPGAGRAEGGDAGAGHPTGGQPEGGRPEAALADGGHPRADPDGAARRDTGLIGRTGGGAVLGDSAGNHVPALGAAAPARPRAAADRRRHPAARTG